MLLAIVAIVGLGTSGTQTLIYGFVANYYRTNVRGAGVAWCAGFGRLGGVGGPLLGGFLVGAGLALNSIFYVLAGVGVLGSLLTLLVPVAGARATCTRRSSSQRAGSTRRDAAEASPKRPDDWRNDHVQANSGSDRRHARLREPSALERTEQIGQLTGATVYILHVARGHIVPGDITGGSGLGVRVRRGRRRKHGPRGGPALVDRLSAAGIDAHGEMLSATEHDVGRASSCSAPGSSTWTCSCSGTSTTAAWATCSGRALPNRLSASTRRSRSCWPDLRSGRDGISSTSLPSRLVSGRLGTCGALVGVYRQRQPRFAASLCKAVCTARMD